jgi:hypothetical protein
MLSKKVGHIQHKNNQLMYLKYARMQVLYMPRYITSISCIDKGNDVVAAAVVRG